MQRNPIVVIAFLAFGVPYAVAQYVPTGCGYVNDPVQCGPSLIAPCECSGGACVDATRLGISRPITYTQFSNPCVPAIKQKTGPCFFRFGCLNSAGFEGGSCASPYEEGYCVDDAGSTIEWDTQTYRVQEGLCSPENCEA